MTRRSLHGGRYILVTRDEGSKLARYGVKTIYVPLRVAVKLMTQGTRYELGAGIIPVAITWRSYGVH